MSNFGQQTPGTNADESNAIIFLFQRLLSRIRTLDLVKVISCTNAGGVSPVGTVNVQVLVNQMTGERQSVPHGTIYSVPYLRIQGGAHAVILDPQAGDIGLCGFCSRDISSVKASKAAANPGSYRMFDWADGVYIFGCLNGTPTQYVQFVAGGMNLVSPTEITLQAPNVTVNASTALTVTSPTAGFSGAVTATDDVTGQTKSLHNHTHGGVTTGSGTTGPPT
jgi:hypothetical protein